MNQPLDYHSPRTSDRSPWGDISLFVGVFGAPISIFLTYIASRILPNGLMATGACGAAALVFIFIAQRKWKGSRRGKVGETLTLVWGSVFLVWSGIILIAS